MTVSLLVETFTDKINSQWLISSSKFQVREKFGISVYQWPQENFCLVLLWVSHWQFSWLLHCVHWPKTAFFQPNWRLVFRYTVRKGTFQALVAFTFSLHLRPFVLSTLHKLFNCSECLLVVIDFCPSDF